MKRKMVKIGTVKKSAFLILLCNLKFLFHLLGTFSVCCYQNDVTENLETSAEARLVTIMYSCTVLFPHLLCRVASFEMEVEEE